MKAKKVTETGEHHESTEEERRRLHDIDTLSNSEILGGEQFLNDSAIDQNGVVLSVGGSDDEFAEEDLDEGQCSEDGDSVSSEEEEQPKQIRSKSH